MTIDEKMVEVISRRYPDANPYEKLRQICRQALSSNAGYQLLCLLNEAVPPMFPSISETQPNDPAAVGLREGRREVSAFLFRYAGMPQQPEQQEPTTE